MLIFEVYIYMTKKNLIVLAIIKHSECDGY